MRLSVLILFIFLSINITETYSQSKIAWRALWTNVLPAYPDNIILTQKVVFEHEGMLMHCDSALFNDKTNSFRAFQNIHIISEDSVNIYGDELYYDGNTQIAELYGDSIIAIDDEATMTTTYLIFERIPNTITYTQGAYIFDSTTTLLSRQGTYYMDSKEIRFIGDVDLDMDSTDIISDTMFYNTKTDYAFFFGPTDIYTKDLYIYTEEGQYNTTTEDCISYEQSYIIDDNSLFRADTLKYSSKTEIAEGFSHIYTEDTVEKVIATGHYMYLNKKDTNSYTYITQKAQVQQIYENDTLFLHSDTIWLNHNSEMKLKNINANRYVKFFRKDFQGAADRIIYDMQDSTVNMYGRPIVWNEQMQFFADTIIITMQEGKIYEINFYPNAFIIQNSDTLVNTRYNQIFGKTIDCYFQDNDIYMIDVDGNAQSVYYLWEEKKDQTNELIGINAGVGASMRIYIDDKKIQKITTIEDAKFFTDNEEDCKPEEKILKGFEWREDERPNKKEDIFIRREDK